MRSLKPKPKLEKGRIRISRGRVCTGTKGAKGCLFMAESDVNKDPLGAALWGEYFASVGGGTTWWLYLKSVSRTVFWKITMGLVPEILGEEKTVMPSGPVNLENEK